MVVYRELPTSFILAVIGVLGLGLAFYRDEWFLPEIVRSVGHALIIAAILGFTVDKIIKERLMKEATRDLIKYLIGYKLPEPLQEHIRSTVLSNVVRMNFELRCELIPSGDKRMTVKAELSYSLRNFSNEERKYTPYLGLEESYSPKYESISVQRVDEPGYFRTTEGTGANKLEVKRKLPGHTYIQGDTLKLEPSPIVEPTFLYRVTFKYTLSMTDNNMYVESLMGPTMNITVRVSCPPEYDVRVGTGKPTPEECGRCWQYKQLFVEGEYIGIRWFPNTHASSPKIAGQP